MVDLGVSEPFGIQSNVDKITFDANQEKKDAFIDFEITKKNYYNDKTTPRSFLMLQVL